MSLLDLEMSRLIAFDAVTVASAAAADSDAFTVHFSTPGRAVDPASVCVCLNNNF